MKRIFLVFTLILSVFALNGAELFYSDGTSVSIQKAEDMHAVKSDASKTSRRKDALYIMNTGSDIYSFVSGTEKRGGDELPIYFLGDMPAVAERTVFWRGEKPVEYMEKKYGMKLLEIMPTYPLYVFSVKGDSVEIAEKIVKNGDGYAFPNFVREADRQETTENFVPESEPEDPYFDAQWYLHNTGTSGRIKNADIKFKQALEFLNSERIEVDPNIKIAIMDTGVARHEDLKITEWGYDSVTNQEAVGGGTPNVHLLEGENLNYETESAVPHGTECAGISAGIGNQIGMSGVCPWCWIYPVRYPTSNSYESGERVGTRSDRYLAIYEKYVNYDISVVNCSFGYPSFVGVAYPSPAEVESHLHFIKNGRDGKGGVIVYSSGNDNVDSSYKRILEYDFVFEREGVGLVTDRVVTVNATTFQDMKADFSNYGYTSTVAAPGIQLVTTTIPGYGYYNSQGSNYTLMSGTSAAAPVVSGLFGVLFSINPDLTLEEAMEILKQSSDKINPETGLWGEDGFSVKFGYGRVNLEKAVRIAAGFPMCAEIKDEECGNNLDDDCNDYVDEGCAEELKAGKPCENDDECLTSSLNAAYVSCVNELLSWVFEGGYCFRKSSSCPEGTRKLGDIKEDSRYFCALECNRSNPCTRQGYYCSDEVLGVCLPLCSDNTDCANGAVCNENGHCVTECGNGVINREDCEGYDNCVVTDGANEECDDGDDNGKTECEYNKGSCKVCTTACQLMDGIKSSCGDAEIDPRNGEECDYSSLNGTTKCVYGMKSCKVCTETCKKGQEDGIPRYCGDGVTDMFIETCDDGNNEDGDYCSANCRTVTGSCGDGTVQSNEECDDGNNEEDDYCSSDCQTITGACGDGTVQSNEECDEGEDNGRGCAYGETSCTVCTTECKTDAGLTSYCGDRYTDAENGEICDEGWRNGELEHCNDSCSGIVEIPEIPDEETPDSDEPADNDETADENEIPDNGGETSDSEEKPDSEEVSDSSESPDKGETAADSEISSDEYGSVSDDDTADEVIEEDFDAENDGDGNTAAENKKKSGGCSLLVL